MPQYSLLWTIEFQFAPNVWTDVEATMGDFTKSEILWKDLKPADSTVNFSVPYSDTLATLMRSIGAEEVPVRIHKDGADYFYGYLRKTFQFKKTQRNQSIKLEAVTGGFLLKKKNSLAISYKDIAVSTLVSNLLVAAGVPIGKITLPTISTVIPYFHVDELDVQYSDVIATLLYEYGYIGCFDATGQYVTQELFPADISTTQVFDGSNCLQEVLQDKDEESSERISVEWNTLVTVPDAIVFEDTTGATAGFSCFITLQPDDYYTPDQAIHEWDAEYKYADKEIVYVDGATLDITKDGVIEVETFTPQTAKASLAIHNTGIIAGNITKLRILGDVTYKGDTAFSIVSKVVGTEKILEYKSQYIYDKESGDALANGLASYYSTSDFSYTIKSKTDYALGSFVIINEMGSITARIIEKKTNQGDGITTYTCEGVTAYTPDTVVPRIINNQPQPTPPSVINTIQTVVEEATSGIVETVYDGYETTSGGTATPEDLVVSIEPQYKALVIRWEKQQNLTNLKEYRVQVSIDETDWYALDFNRTDWKGDTEGAYTVTNATMLVHTLPDNIIAGISNPWTLFYRVKQVTRAGLESNYVAIQGTSALVDSGGLAANSIIANTIAAGAVTAEKIATQTITADKIQSVSGNAIQTGAIQSTTFSTGVSGWNLPLDGSAEFNSVTVRGTAFIQAGSFSGSIQSGPLTLNISPPSSTTKSISAGVNLVTWMDEFISATGITEASVNVSSGTYNGTAVGRIDISRTYSYPSITQSGTFKVGGVHEAGQSGPVFFNYGFGIWVMTYYWHQPYHTLHTRTPKRWSYSLAIYGTTGSLIASYSTTYDEASTWNSPSATGENVISAVATASTSSGPFSRPSFPGDANSYSTAIAGTTVAATTSSTTLPYAGTISLTANAFTFKLTNLPSGYDSNYAAGSIYVDPIDANTGYLKVRR